MRRWVEPTFKGRTNGALSPSISTEPTLAEQAIVAAYNDTPGDLKGADCPKCKNKGNIMFFDTFGLLRVRECECMATRRSMWLLEKSGLDKTLDVYSWERWQTVEPWQKIAYEWARKYAESPNGWFIMSGRPGTGKTHLCTAICGDQIKKGIPTRYLVWREFVTAAKALVTDSAEYKALVDPFKRVKVLYIDDFFKSGSGEAPTAGDKNVAFELINARYADPEKITIISTELTMEKLLDVDEAIGSRIYERSKGNYLDISKKRNWRLQ